jgi:hypothetical protein
VEKIAGIIGYLTMYATHLWLRKKLLKRLHYQQRRGNVIRDRKACLEEIDTLPDYIFRQMFRMTRPMFTALLEKINTVLPDKGEQNEMASRNCKGSRGQPLGNKTKLYATLRFLAGGSPWDICLAYRIGFGSFYAKTDWGVIWPIMRAIDQAYDISLDVTNTQKLDDMAKEYAAIMPVSGEVFDGCVMAIDGWVMMTRKPKRNEVKRVTSYRNRKGCWAIVVLAGNIA